MKNALKSNASISRVEKDSPAKAIARLGIAPGVIETIVASSAAEVPGVAEVGGPKVSRKKFNSVLAKDGISGVKIIAEGDNMIIDIRIQIFYGYKLKDIVEGIRTNVSDALASHAGIEVDAINIYVSALRFEEI